jgi:hypothetical protein
LHFFSQLLKIFLLEDETYGLLCNLATCREPKYFSQSKLQCEVEWRTIMELNKEYNVSTEY